MLPIIQDSNVFKERVRQATDLADVASQFTQMKLIGRTLKGLCPLPGHTEKTPSFTIHKDMSYYYCFGCQRGGDVFQFAQEVMGLSFKEALELFAQKAGIPQPTYYTNYKISQNSQNETLYEKKVAFLKVNKLANNIFQNNLKNLPPHHTVLAYLRKRNLHPETLKKFEIGYSLPDWSALSKKLSHCKDLAYQLGFIRKSDRGDDYDVYRNRIMFPIITIRDEIIGFGGRSLVETNREAKYINSPTSDIFQKGQVLYGLKQAAPYIRSLDQVIVVEGYMDVVTLYQNGFCNVVGVLGTALTLDHAHLLKKYTKNIILLFDSDAAGQKAAEKALPILLNYGLYPRVLKMPDGQDPDSIMKQWGREKFQKQLSNCSDLFDHILKHYIAQKRLTPTVALDVLDRMGPIMTSMQDNQLKYMYIQRLADSLRITPSMVRSHFSPQKTKKTYNFYAEKADQRKQIKKKEKITAQLEKSVHTAEMMVAAIVANEPQYLKILEEEDMLEKFSSEKISGFLKKIQDISRHQKVDLGNLLSSSTLLNDKFVAHANTKLDTQLIEYIMKVASYKDISQTDKLFRDAVKRIKEHFLKEEGRVHAENLNQFMEIQKTRQNILNSR